jgi:hypothetical protein
VLVLLVVLWSAWKEGYRLELSTQTHLSIRSGEQFLKTLRQSSGGATKSIRSLRAEVSCTGASVRNCKIYLPVYEIWQSERWEQLNIARVQLKWADDVKRESQDIHPTAPAQAVFALATEGDPQLTIAGGQSPPRLGPGKYRFTIVSAGENAPEATCRVEVNWNGDWQTVQVSVA